MKVKIALTAYPRSNYLIQASSLGLRCPKYLVFVPVHHRTSTRLFAGHKMRMEIETGTNKISAALSSVYSDSDAQEEIALVFGL